MIRLALASALLTFVLAAAAPAGACTTTIVTRGASADGSVLVSHSDDDHLMDQSLVFVPARDWPAGSLRPVYPSAVALGEIPDLKAFFIPRLVDGERAPGYRHPQHPASRPLGHIPQAEHTYAYLDGNYGIINEHGLMFGECTDGVKVTHGPEPGRRLFYSSELSRVALERCRTAREAVLLMGQLIEEYGYYGTGETLPVADANEAWVMEMAPTQDGSGGLWVAQLVPDGHFFVAANEFRIRDINPAERGKTQLYSDKLFEIIKKDGWRQPEDSAKPLDWLLTVSHGEYSHPYYSLRRVWRALSLAAPSLNLSPWVQDGATRDYPFSVQPDRPLTLDDLKAIHRDVYQGTPFDLTQGAAAGPFGNPHRYLGPQDPSGDVGDPSVELEGAWERPINMYYIGYTFINQLRPDLPYPINAVSWVALNTPAESVFLPLAVAPAPKSYEKGDPSVFDWDSAWRIYNLVGEYANLKYSHMIKDIQGRAAEHEIRSANLLASLWSELAPLAAENPQEAAQKFGQALRNNAEKARLDWLELFTELVVKYSQGYLNAPGKMAVGVGYPDQWLDGTNYRQGPTSYDPPEGADQK